jgi:hypothetical protein
VVGILGIRIDPSQRWNGEPLVYASPCIGYIEIAECPKEKYRSSEEDILQPGNE